MAQRFKMKRGRLLDAGEEEMKRAMVVGIKQDERIVTISNTLSAGTMIKTGTDSSSPGGNAEVIDIVLKDGETTPPMIYYLCSRGDLENIQSIRCRVDREGPSSVACGLDSS